MAQLAGEYSLTIDLIGTEILDSPFTMNVLPGDVDPPQSTTSLGSVPLAGTAGTTIFFTIQMVDIYGNAEIASKEGNSIELIAKYNDHSAWASPIGVADYSNWQQIYG